jgi:hypothetical protein
VVSVTDPYDLNLSFLDRLDSLKRLLKYDKSEIYTVMTSVCATRHSLIPILFTDKARRVAGSSATESA